MGQQFKDTEEIVYAYRQAYLEHIQGDAPEVWQDLRDLSLRYSSLFGPAEFPHGGMAQYLFLESEAVDPVFIMEELTASRIDRDLTDAESSAVESFLSLCNDFASFVTKYYLDAKWLRLAMLRGLSSIARDPMRPPPLWGFYEHGFLPLAGDSLLFEFEGWSAAADKSDQYKAKALSAFNRHLDAYVQIVGMQASNRGYVRSTGRPHDLSKVQWLVWWNIHKQTKNQIALRAGTYKENVNETFDIFRDRGLPVRLGVAGRPKREGKLIPI